MFYKSTKRCFEICSISYAGPYHMLDRIICWAISYAGPYHMLGHIICWAVLYAGPYHMQGHIICRATSYAGPYHMLSHIICRAIYHMLCLYLAQFQNWLFLWHNLHRDDLELSVQEHKM